VSLPLLVAEEEGTQEREEDQEGEGGSGFWFAVAKRLLAGRLVAFVRSSDTGCEFEHHKNHVSNHLHKKDRWGAGCEIEGVKRQHSQGPEEGEHSGGDEELELGFYCVVSRIRHGAEADNRKEHFKQTKHSVWAGGYTLNGLEVAARRILLSMRRRGVVLHWWLSLLILGVKLFARRIANRFLLLLLIVHIRGGENRLRVQYAR